VHELGGTTGQRREADPHDRADVRGRGRLDDALVEAARRLHRLDEQQPVPELGDVGLPVGRREQLRETWPQPGAPAVGVLVEAGTLELRGAPASIIASMTRSAGCGV
jgi:hypothetical protein